MVRSRRRYPRFDDIRSMVSRSAYDQLGRSPLLLAGTVVGMTLVYGAPPLLAAFGTGSARDPWARNLHSAQLAAPLLETLLLDLEAEAKAHPRPDLLSPAARTPASAALTARRAAACSVASCASYASRFPP